MGLADKMVGTAYLDDAIWPRYAEEYSAIPVLSSSYPNETTIMSVEPDFIMGSYKSAFAEHPRGSRNGIFTNKSVTFGAGEITVGPCDGENSDWFAAGSTNETNPTAYSTCRQQLNENGCHGPCPP